MMPEEGFDPGPDSEEDIAWDPDTGALGESDLFDLLDDGLGYVNDSFPEEI